MPDIPDYSESLLAARKALLEAENAGALHHWARARSFLYTARFMLQEAVDDLGEKIDALVLDKDRESAGK